MRVGPIALRLVVGRVLLANLRQCAVDQDLLGSSLLGQVLLGKSSAGFGEV